MHPIKLFLPVLVPAVLVALTTPAHADCALGDDYTNTVDGNTVHIAMTGEQNRTCPDSGGMLRQDESGGAIVKLADFCASGAYVDECVPPGTYRYGLATPFTCDSAACGGTPYYVEVTVTQGLSGTCTRSSGDSGPTAATSVPWTSNSLVCSGYQETGGSTTTTTSGGTTTSGTTTSPGGNGNGGGGCSVGRVPGAVPVLGANALALVAGLLLMRRAKGKKS